MSIDYVKETARQNESHFRSSKTVTSSHELTVTLGLWLRLMPFL